MTQPGLLAFPLAVFRHVVLLMTFRHSGQGLPSKNALWGVLLMYFLLDVPVVWMDITASWEALSPGRSAYTAGLLLGVVAVKVTLVYLILSWLAKKLRVEGAVGTLLLVQVGGDSLALLARLTGVYADVYLWIQVWVLAAFIWCGTVLYERIKAQSDDKGSV